MSRAAATALIRQRPESSPTALRPVVVIGTVVVTALAAFLFLPGSIEEKTHAALHGLCAQRPTHSIRLGNATLPFDARMTGIYVGAVATFLWLAARRRLRVTRLPSPSVLVVLAAFVLAMVGDGLDGLLVDLGRPSLYAPSNDMRIVTGLLAGIALGVALGHLLAVSLWAHGEHRRHIVGRPHELLAPLAAGGVVCALALTGWSILYAPFALGLLVAATGVFWVLAIVVLALVTGRGWSYGAVVDLGPIAGRALVAAIITIALLAGLRFAAEQVLGLPKFT
jgi:uncharacterized membrane protein